MPGTALHTSNNNSSNIMNNINNSSMKSNDTTLPDDTQMLNSDAPAATVEILTPIKSASDTREYRLLKLANGLTTLLIHDSDTDKAAAAMDVAVGHWLDPDDIPGLAHFLEHMLFLGTEKFPNENEYSAYLNEHGGHSNAYTSAENTNYFFEVRHEYLHPMLIRFAQFFLSPLFTPSATGRELEAVNSEHAKNLLNDVWRMSQLLKSFANPSHPFHKFGTGNIDTLSTPHTREALLEFHSRWYSANIMHLVILGRESLDELQITVETLFASISNKNVKLPSFPTQPFPLHSLTSTIADNTTTKSTSNDASLASSPTIRPPQHFATVVPVKDLRSLHLMFPLPATYSHYRFKPSYLISHCTGHESGGSILAYLKSRSFANALSSGLHDSFSAFSMFSISIELSELGLRNIEEIIRIVFAYIQELKTSSTEEWARIFEEERDINSMNFRFKSKESPMNYVSHLASDLRIYSPEDSLRGPYLYEKFDEPLLRSFLAQLSPENMLVDVVSKSFANKTSRSEPWYGTEYEILSFSADAWASFITPPKYTELHLPKPNPYIATDFTLKHVQTKSTNVASPKDTDEPSKVDESDALSVQKPAITALESPKSPKEDSGLNLTPPIQLRTAEESGYNLWFKADTTFARPKANVLLKLISPVAYSSPRLHVMSTLFSRLLEDSLNELSYSADIAGLSHSIQATSTGLQFVLGGYNHKLGVLADTILSRMLNLTIAEDRFSVIKEALIRQIRNFAMEQPYQHAMYDELFSVETGLWHNSEKAAVADTLTVEDLRSFFPSLFAFAQVTILVHGNMLAEDAIDLANSIKSKLAYKPLLPSEIPELRVVKLSSGTRYVRSVRELNPQDENSASVVCFEIGEDTPANNALAELLGQVCRDAVYHQLRTVEQLGYLVWSGITTHRGVIYFRIIVQSSTFDAIHLENRIEAFLAHFESELRSMKVDQFSKHVHSVIARKSEKDKSLVQESNRHWHEITLRRYTFDRAAREVRHLERISHPILVEFYNNYVLIPETRAKLSIQVHGKNHPLPSDDDLRAQFAPTDATSHSNISISSSVVSDDAAGKVEDIRIDQIVEAVITPTLDNDASNASASDKPFLPSVPVDTAPLIVIHDMLKFKSSMPLHPCYI